MAINAKYRPVTTKKYLIFLGFVIGAIFIILYVNKWHQVKEQEKYFNSYLINTNTISLEMNDIREISSVLSETPNSYFIYISYTQDKDVYNFEKKLKPLIDEYNLQNNFYFINVTNIKKQNKNYKKDIASALKINDSFIKDVPVILYFKDGTLINSGVTSIEDFKELLKVQNIKAI